VVSQHIKQ